MLILMLLPAIGAACLAGISDADWKQMGADLRKAMAYTQTSVKELAIVFGFTNNAHLTRMLDGEKPFPLHLLTRAPRDLRRWFFFFQLQREGLPQEIATGAALVSSFGPMERH
jgi:hypothetical protein